MTISRRQFFKSALGAFACVATANVLPKQVWAAWSDKAFVSETLVGAITGKYGTLPIEDSTAITIKAPEIAENGAYVPVSFSTTIQGATNISILSEGNYSPMVASFDLLPRTVPEFAIRMRMVKTANLVVLVQANGKLYRATKEVKVTIGGCGG